MGNTKKNKTFLRRIINTIVFLLNLLAVVWVLLCKWAAFYNPEGHPNILSLLSLTTAFAFLCNIAFIIYWVLVKKWWRTLISVIPIILLLGMFQSVIGIHVFSHNTLKSQDVDLKIMTWNVHLFDLGAWTQNKATKTKIINLIQKEDPDVLCLEEFYWDAKQNGQPYTDIIRGLGYPYVAFAKLHNMPERRLTIKAEKGSRINSGLVLFSKFPFKDTKNYELASPNDKMLSVEVTIDEQHTININVIHLTSFHLKEEEMVYIEGVKKKGMTDKQDTRKAKSLLKKLMLANTQRAVLANDVDSLKRFMNYPMIICGDFNDVPSSYVYNTVKGNLKDPFMSKGYGFGRTYRKILPTLRIDYILYDRNTFNVAGYARPRVKLSDHYPVIATFTFQ